jgi:hypothetical protein
LIDPIWRLSLIQLQVIKRAGHLFSQPLIHLCRLVGSQRLLFNLIVAWTLFHSVWKKGAKDKFHALENGVTLRLL